MKKRYIGIVGLGLVLALGTQQVHAQQGFGTDKPAKSAAVDIQSSKRGLLIPRVDLKSTVNGTTPINTPEQSLMVYNQATTTTEGANDVTPGYYYWDTDRWVRFAQQGDFSEITLAGDVTGKVGETKVVALQGTAISNVAPTANQVLVFVPGEGTNPGQWKPANLPTQPWNIQGGNTKATENTQNIYQQGKVGIGFTKDSIATKTLDVRGDFKTEAKLGNRYNGMVTNEPIESFSSSVLYSSKKPFTSYVDLASQAEHSFLMLSDAGTMIQRQGSSSKSLVSIGAQSDDYMLAFSGEKAGKSSTIQMNEALMYLKQANTKSDSQIRLKANEGITFSTLLEDDTRSSYIFPTSNGNANQVLTTNGVQATNSTSAQLTWKNVTDLITPGTAGQVLTTTKDGDNDPKVEWKAPAVHENIYTHNGTLTQNKRTVDFGEHTSMLFKRGTQRYDFTFDSTRIGLNMWGSTESSIGLLTQEGGMLNGIESKLQMFHQRTLSQINANSEEGLRIAAGFHKNITLGTFYYNPGEVKEYYNSTLVVKGDGGVQVVNINKPEFKGSASDKVVVADADGVLKALKAVMPKFFYMPSVMVPTAANQATQSGVTFDNTSRIGTINLYAIYEKQFGTPVKSSPGATALPVLPASELGFHVTYATEDVFTIQSIDDHGLMTYKVSETANVNAGSFINIVFSVKE
ncbi:hypothetical protein [Myroides sp. DW712]|uniref:hypothetical protein n=1 Tax=Myroides sp. DW712 TaxID=3389800 RepID=UPI0039783276